MKTETVETIEPSEQAAAVCYRLGNDQEAPVEFLLVRTKGRQDRWIFPKGRIKKGEPAWKAALREAHEEAGITLHEDSCVYLMQFRHRELWVDAFLFKAEAQHRPLEKHRRPRWFTAEKALGALSENRTFDSAAELKRVLRKAVAVISPSLPPEEINPERVEEQSLSVFLCHASEDRAAVQALRLRLISSGFRPWLDQEDLLPGQDWNQEIKKAVRRCDVILVCLSKHSEKSGYLQTEIVRALDIYDELPGGTIYLIPVKLEECRIPDRLARHCVDLSQENNYVKLEESLKAKARSIREHGSGGVR